MLSSNLRLSYFITIVCVSCIIIFYQLQISKLYDEIRNLELLQTKAAVLAKTKAASYYEDSLVIIYNRVPKTGSTSFVGVAYDLCKKNHFHVLHINITANNHVLSLPNQFKFVKNITHWDAMKPALYHGHFAFLDFSRFGGKKPLFINIIRRPLDRLVSYYYFLRYGDNFRPYLVRRKHGNTMTFDDCVRNDLPDCDPNNMWLQVPFFCGHSANCWKPGNKWALTEAKKNLVNNYFLVGVTEELDDFIKLLELSLPRMFKEQSNSSNSLEDGQDSWFQNSARNVRSVNTPLGGTLPMPNNTNVQFESPKVPVIFILGGPGSGKVTHCDNLMQEKKGIIHINMTDLLQQYALGNDMQDFSLLSSKTVTEVLMLEMKMSPSAKTYLVSGYPRNMRDVVEYTEKIQVINGAVLISWRQKVLERQIDYGAKLGQVVLSLARMELNNFFKNVMPVADYFDQSNMLVTINGERHPGDVYKDFKAAVMKILGTQDNPPVFTNGLPPEVPANVTTELPNVVSFVFGQKYLISEQLKEQPRPGTQVISVNNPKTRSLYNPPAKQGWPPVIWVIGGPGSNKAALCEEVSKDTGWAHVSLGRLLREAAQSADQRNATDFKMIRDSISSGELVPFDIVMKILEMQLNANLTASGIIIDGYPRDMTQVTEFEAKFKQRPTVILLDCSKLQLGRGRLDDSVTAFRRRLEIFRQSSLPMLKAMDNIGRLTIVDGDTDSNPVKQDFKNVIDQNIDYIKQNSNEIHMNGHISNGVANHVEHDSTAIETISKKVHDVGNGVAVAVTNGVNHIANGFSHVGNGISHMANGHGPIKVTPVGKQPNYADLDVQRRENIRNIYSEINHI
ncbi:hypothetical protein FQR65_LT10894 [Abscondita terminalis]|nr:hypothetical protein FQR65_LT10894 [Abscondita terminalis]